MSTQGETRWILWPPSGGSPASKPGRVVNKKAGRFSGSGEDCVEVAFVPGAVAVRDTKHRSGGTLTFPESAWHHLLKISSASVSSSG
ncbi:DUF397 domain-containing protein [Kibdelosporangium aridum]|uniref:DUF397 domain-containing protein n=1 Tax=Kibdelosporangium aridum TaxID=2030 RepID=A0A428YY31_KIBAR|nr:DUF397 domain-containing protein [Kibdelosporangium aridum]